MNTTDKEAHRFRAGDTVQHIPTGELWSLAYDEDGGKVSADGWPESLVPAEDCKLVEAATDCERLDTLKKWAGNVATDHRTIAARRQLKERE